MNKFKILLVTSRPLFWSLPIFIYIAGVMSNNWQWNNLTFIGFIYITFPLGLTIFGLNDIADHESDILNPRKGGVEGAILKPNTISLILTTIVSLNAAFIFLLLLTNKIPTLFLIIICLFLSYAYSFKPFRLKSIPILDSLSNSIGFFMVFLLGRTLSNTGSINLTHLPKASFVLVFGIWAIHALSTVVDYDIDKKVHDQTTATSIGKQNTILLTLILYMTTWIFAGFNNFAVNIYLSFCLISCLAMYFINRPKFIYTTVWTIVLTFPVLCTYLLLQNFDYLMILLN